MDTPMAPQMANDVSDGPVEGVSPNVHGNAITDPNIAEMGLCEGTMVALQNPAKEAANIKVELLAAAKEMLAPLLIKVDGFKYSYAWDNVKPVVGAVEQPPASLTDKPDMQPAMFHEAKFTPRKGDREAVQQHRPEEVEAAAMEDSATGESEAEPRVVQTEAGNLWIVENS